MHPEGNHMLATNSMIVMLVVGPIAGWLAGQIMRGSGFGLIGDIIIGIIGAFIGVWLLAAAARHARRSGFLGSILIVIIGAVVLR